VRGVRGVWVWQDELPSLPPSLFRSLRGPVVQQQLGESGGVVGVQCLWLCCAGVCSVVVLACCVVSCCGVVSVCGVVSCCAVVGCIVLWWGVLAVISCQCRVSDSV